MKILVTGAAGFIGHRTTQILCEMGYDVVAIDNLNTYYDVALKLARLRDLGIDVSDGRLEHQSSKYSSLTFLQIDVTWVWQMKHLFDIHGFDYVVHLAAQAGVRYSIDHPDTYVTNNVNGFYAVLDLCRTHSVKHFVYASSSSVYGEQDHGQFLESDVCDKPKSLYAATKKADELFAYAYSEIYGLPTTGLRFFTVYGEYGRPDMSPMIFANAIEKGEPIKVFNNGQMYRDFTYIDDVVGAIVKAIDRPSEDNVPYRIYNVGNANPILLIDFIKTLEQIMGKTANKIMMPMQKGDVTSTNASTYRICYDLGWTSHTKIDQGLRKFVEWFRSEKNPIAG